MFSGRVSPLTIIFPCGTDVNIIEMTGTKKNENDTCRQTDQTIESGRTFVHDGGGSQKTAR